MIYRYRGPHSGIEDVEGGRERGVCKYLRWDHGWSEQFPENISIISIMVIIYSNVGDGDDDDNYEVDNMMMIDMIIMLMAMVMMARTCSR